MKVHMIEPQMVPPHFLILVLIAHGESGLITYSSLPPYPPSFTYILIEPYVVPAKRRKATFTFLASSGVISMAILTVLPSLLAANFSDGHSSSYGGRAGNNNQHHSHADPFPQQQNNGGCPSSSIHNFIVVPGGGRLGVLTHNTATHGIIE